ADIGVGRAWQVPVAPLYVRVVRRIRPVGRIVGPVIIRAIIGIVVCRRGDIPIGIVKPRIPAVPPAKSPVRPSEAPTPTPAPTPTTAPTVATMPTVATTPTASPTITTPLTRGSG